MSAAKRLEKATKGKESYGKICSILKNKYEKDNWYLIKDKYFTEIMDWLRRYYYSNKEKYKSPGQRRKELIGIIKSQQKMLVLNNREYRELLFRITGKTSTTQMEIYELERVKDNFNILLGSKKQFT